MYEASQPTATSSTTQLYCLPTMQAGNTRCDNSFQDKGKRREEVSTSIEPVSEILEYGQASSSTILGGSTSAHFLRKSHQRQCPHLSPPLFLAESDGPHTPTKQSPLENQTTSKAFTNTMPSPLYTGPMTEEAVTKCPEANLGSHSAYEDHSGPMSYSASDETMASSHTAADKRMSSLGLRRRPYQGGIRPFDSQSSDNENMSRIDRESIFSGLNLDLNLDTRSSRTLDSTDFMTSSSIKRSFEEAISPSRSPRAGSSSSGNRNRRQGNQEDGLSSLSSKAFSSSVSHPVVSLRNNDHTGPLIGSSDLQSARRRIPYKRRRATSLESSSDMDACLVSANRGDGRYRASMTTKGKDKTASRSTEAVASPGEGSRRGDTNSNDGMPRTSRLVQRDSTRAPRLPVSEDRVEIDLTMDSTDDSSDAMNQSQSRVMDTEEPVEVHFRSLGNLLPNEDIREATQSTRTGESTGTSSAFSSNRQDAASATRSVLRHLQLQESSESDDMNIASNPSTPSHGMQYHDQLMDVFRRLNEGASGRETESNRPSILPRSAPMHRSTTQLSDMTRGPSSNLNSIHVPTRFERDAEDLSTTPAAPLLPSARAYETQASRDTQERMARLRSQMDRYAELSRRNQEVLTHYQSGPFTSRLRHSGSPTFADSLDHPSNADVYSWYDDALVSSSRPHSISTRGDDRTVTSPTNDLSTNSHSHAHAPVRSSLWGEYSRNRGVGEENRLFGSTDHGYMPFDSFNFLFPTFDNHSTDQGVLEASLEQARRSEELRSGTNGQDIDFDDFVRRGREETIRANRVSRLEDEAMVMRRYRDMEFPDPEATIDNSSQIPQLPTLRSPSPLISPFESAATDFYERSRRQEDQSRWNRSPLRTPTRTEPFSDWQASRPSLRPLRLTSRLAERSQGSSDTPAFLGESRREEETPSTFMEDSRPRRPLSTRDGLRRDDEHSYRLTPFRHRREVDERIARRRVDEDRRRQSLEEAAASLPRRLTLNNEHSREMRNQIAAASSTGRRSNSNLLDNDANSNDTQRSSRLRERRLLVPPQSNTAGIIGRPRGAVEAARSTRPYIPFTRFGPRLSSRYDRYLDAMGSSSSATPLQQNGPISSSSSNSLASMLSSSSSSSTAYPPLFNLSRLPSGSSFTNPLRSEIAMNPDNYVADDDFALRDTYEGLLQLSAQIGDVRCRSTPSQVIDSLPTCLYDDWLGGSCCKTPKRENSEYISTNASTSSTVINKGKAKAKEDYDDLIKLRNSRDTTCSICLESYQASEMMMSLPCDHAFHACCVTTWLKTARSCPCCRGNVCKEEVIDNKSRSFNFGSIPWYQILPELNF